MEKILCDVFKDFTSNGNIVFCKIKEINIFKKTNRLELQLISDKNIEISEIQEFEEFLKNKFKIETVKITINYTKEIQYSIIENWNDIVNYMSKKYPLTKAILKNSKIEITNKTITVKIEVKNGTEILNSRKFDELLSEFLANLTGVNYKITYKEEIAEDARINVEKQMKEAEIQAINELKQNAIKEAKQKVIQEQQKDSGNAEDANIEEKNPLIYGRANQINGELSKIADLSVDSGEVLIDGEIISSDVRELKNGKDLICLNVYDGTSTITCKVFATKEKSKEIQKRCKEAKGVRLKGEASYDQFSKELGIMTKAIIESTGIKREKRMDNAEEKRVELHLHTQMSQMDGVSSATDLIKRAISWGMKSIAITDHGVVQAFPEAKKASKDSDIKIIYGVEAYLVPDKNPTVFLSKGQALDCEYCVLDIETTGLSFRTEKITEIAVVRIKNGEILEEFSCFVNPEVPIPERIVEITNITDEMVKNAETIEQVMPKFLEFIGDSVLVAHNASFDIGFLKYNAAKLGLKMDNTYIDTLSLSRGLFPEFKKHKLGFIAENLNIKVDVAHRALDDVITLIKVFNVMLEKLKEKKDE